MTSSPGQLAVALDAELGQDRAWAAQADRLSLALTLVEATYPAIAGASGDADARALIESWNGERHQEIRERLVDLAGPASVSTDDLRAWLERRSAVRRDVRLLPFGLTEGDLSTFFAGVTPATVPNAEVRVLVGSFGSGKSEAAEVWHRSCTSQLRTSTDPLPAWLSARELTGRSLAAALDETVGNRWRGGRGTAVVVDGLDEVDAADAAAILEEARVLVRTEGNCRALLTARPGVLHFTEDETIDVDGLTHENASRLVESLVATRNPTWRWTDDLRETVRRPFFALAAGTMLGSDTAPRGEADLIRALVEHALSRASEQSPLRSAEAQQLLIKLAVSLTESGTSGQLSFAERQAALATRLVTRVGDGIAFALPIFQQWFAALALTSGVVSSAEVVRDQNRFVRWRWAAAVALLSTTDPASLDALLATWTAGNPGAAAWIMKEAMSSHPRRRDTTSRPLDPATSGPRLLRALRVWSDALGPLAPGLLPDEVTDGPVRLGVRVSGHSLFVALASERPIADEVVEPPVELHPFMSTRAAGWQPWFGGPVSEGDVWPWAEVRSQVSKRVLPLLNTEAYLGTDHGVWLSERRYSVARAVMSSGSLYHEPVPADLVRTGAEQALARLHGHPDGRLVTTSRGTVYGFELFELIDWIDRTSATEIGCGLPGPDQKHAGRWIWDSYSTDRLAQLEAEVYGRACDAFDEALATSFSNLDWALPSSGLGRFGTLLELTPATGNEFGDCPGVSVIRVPEPLLEALAAEVRRPVTWSTNRRAAISINPSGRENMWTRYLEVTQMISTWVAQNGSEQAPSLGVSSSIADDMGEKRPASAVAATWLWNDLKELGLGEGTFPQLR